MASGPIVISSWATTSPYGLGTEPFVNGLWDGISGVRPLNDPDKGGPFARAGIVPDFSVSAILGSRGTRSIDRLTGLVVTTVGLVLESIPGGPADEPEGTGLVLGTGSGSVRSIMSFTRDSLTGDKPFHVDPARFPNTVMNRAAALSAIWYGLKGPNVTVAGGALSGLLALSTSARMQHGGHSDALLFGAAEELTAERAWLEWHSRTEFVPADRNEPLSEGCAMFLMEMADHASSHDRIPLATVLGSRFGAFHTIDSADQVLRKVIREVLGLAGLDAGKVQLIAPAEPAGLLGELELSALAEELGQFPEAIRCRSLIGDTSAASAAFQLAGLLAVATKRPDLAGCIALLTCLDRDGTAGCALLRLHRPPSNAVAR